MSHPKIDAILLSQPEADREELWDILLSDRPSRRVSKALTEAGHPIGRTTIQDFRKMRRGSRYIPLAAEKALNDCE